MPEDRKQQTAAPVYFTPMQKSPGSGRLESWAIRKEDEQAIGRLVKDQYRMDGDPSDWYPDAKLLLLLPDLPLNMGSRLAAAREIVLDHWIAAAPAPAAPAPAAPAPAAPAPAAPAPAAPAPAAPAGTGTMFDDL